MKDRKGQASTFVSPHLLQNFKKTIFQSSCPFPVQSPHSKAKIEPGKQNNHSIPNHHNHLAHQINQSQNNINLQIFYQSHFQQIQQILKNQNDNLKQQNEYLFSEIRRITKKQKCIRQQLQEITFLSLQQQNCIVKLQNDYQELKEFLQQKKQNFTVILQSNSLAHLKNSLNQFIHSLSQILNLQNREDLTPVKVRQKQFQERTADEYLQNEIERLSSRLENLVKENNSLCKEPTVRRECIQIAKQIKLLQNRKKTPGSIKQHHQVFQEKPRCTTPKNNIKNCTNRQKTSRFSLEQPSRTKRDQNDDNFKSPKQICNRITHRRKENQEARLTYFPANSILNR